MEDKKTILQLGSSLLGLGALGDIESRDPLVLQTIEFKCPDYLCGTAKPRQEQAKSTKVGRNEPCPCGSGKKYKKCCGR